MTSLTSPAGEKPPFVSRRFKQIAVGRGQPGQGRTKRTAPAIHQGQGFFSRPWNSFPGEGLRKLIIRVVDFSGPGPGRLQGQIGQPSRIDSRDDVPATVKTPCPPKGSAVSGGILCGQHGKILASGEVQQPGQVVELLDAVLVPMMLDARSAGRRIWLRWATAPLGDVLWKPGWNGRSVSHPPIEVDQSRLGGLDR